MTKTNLNPQGIAAQESRVQESAAQERAAQERAAQERAAQERAAQERAAQERTAQERAAQEVYNNRTIATAENLTLSPLPRRSIGWWLKAIGLYALGTFFLIAAISGVAGLGFFFGPQLFIVFNFLPFNPIALVAITAYICITLYATYHAIVSSSVYDLVRKELMKFGHKRVETANVEIVPDPTSPQIPPKDDIAEIEINASTINPSKSTGPDETKADTDAQNPGNSTNANILNYKYVAPWRKVVLVPILILSILGLAVLGITGYFGLMSYAVTAHLVGKSLMLFKAFSMISGAAFSLVFGALFIPDIINNVKGLGINDIEKSLEEVNNQRALNKQPAIRSYSIVKQFFQRSFWVGLFTTIGTVFTAKYWRPDPDMNLAKSVMLRLSQLTLAPGTALGFMLFKDFTYYHYLLYLNMAPLYASLTVTMLVLGALSLFVLTFASSTIKMWRYFEEKLHPSDKELDKKNTAQMLVPELTIAAFNDLNLEDQHEYISKRAIAISFNQRLEAHPIAGKIGAAIGTFCSVNNAVFMAAGVVLATYAYMMSGPALAIGFGVLTVFCCTARVAEVLIYYTGLTQHYFIDKCTWLAECFFPSSGKAPALDRTLVDGSISNGPQGNGEDNDNGRQASYVTTLTALGGAKKIASTNHAPGQEAQITGGAESISDDATTEPSRSLAGSDDDDPEALTDKRPHRAGN